MPVLTSQVTSEGSVISETLFGGNVLANRGTIEGDGQYATAIEDLGVTSLRYPGGSRTEKFFDINDPDKEQVVDLQTGQTGEWMALSDFMDYAEENGHPVLIVIPTKFNLSKSVDENGNRTPEFNEDELRTFIRDVATGQYGNPKIQAFEIGNEYWHSGQMNSLEYGRLAAKMTDVIDDELTKVTSLFPEASDIDIVSQMGENFGYATQDDQPFEGMDKNEKIAALNEKYSLELGEEAINGNGSVDWNYVNNIIIINEFEKADSMDEVDGVVAHVYSHGETKVSTRSSELETLEETWFDAYPDLETYVTEWNMIGVSETLVREESYGLHQAEEMLNIIEEFAKFDVDHANVWPLIQTTNNSLNRGFEYGDTSAPGEIFKMMLENTSGKTTLDLNPHDEKVTEAVFDDLKVHGFAGEGELVLYITPTNDEGVTTSNVDLSQLIVGFETMSLSILGVESGSAIGSNRSSAELETIDHSLVYEDGSLDVTLDPGEILQVIIGGVTPTDALSPFVEPQVSVYNPVEEPEDEFDEIQIPYVEVDEDATDITPETEEPEGSLVGDMVGDMGLSALMAAVPLLGLLFLAG